MTILAIALLCTIVLSVSASADSGPLPPLYTYDLTPTARVDRADPRAIKAAWDEAHAVATLQGIVNRDAPRLYLFFVGGPKGETDRFWWDRMREPGEWLHGRLEIPISSLEEMIDRFRDRIDGAVVYDDRVPATSNLASTFAGVENRIAIRYDPTTGSIYDRLIVKGPRLPVKRRLFHEDGSPLFTGEGHLPGSTTPSTGSAKTDAYLWLKETLLDPGGASPRRMAYYIDAGWIRNPAPGGDIANHTLVNHDYFVAERALFFDLGPWDDEVATDDPNAPRGADRRVLQELLLSAWKRTRGREMIHVGGFVPWAFKYTKRVGGNHDDVPTEWEYARILSAYNAYMDADALGLGAMANASFTRHFPLKKRYPQRASLPTEERLRSLGYLTDGGRVRPLRYYTFYIGDWDAASWLYRMMPDIWNDPERGKIPLGWAINPNLADRAPYVMDWLRRTATPNDFFVSGDSGAGYVNPGMLQEPRPISGLPSGLDAWTRHNRTRFRQWGLRHVGFVIDGFAPGLSKAGLDAYAAFAPGGIVAQKTPPLSLHGDMPVVRMDADLDNNAGRAAAMIRERFGPASAPPKEPDLRIFRAILKSPSWYRHVTDQVSAENDSAGYTLVDPFTFFELARRLAK